MHLQPLSAPNLALATDLYTQAFPEIERRPVTQWVNYWQEENLFNILEIVSDDKFIGFLSYWDFSSFVYVEHFAIMPHTRGHGIGGRAVARFKEQTQSKPIILEVEEPTDDISKRRIAFYQKQGFTLSNKPYLQPPYTSQGLPFPLRIMSTDPNFTDTMFNCVVKRIHQCVYGVKAK